MTPNIFSIEEAWTMVATLGFLFSFYLGLHGWFDLRAVERAIRMRPPRARRWGPRWWVALSTVVANGSLCVVWTGFLVIGAIALKHPTSVAQIPASDILRMTHPGSAEVRLLIGWILIAMEVILAGVQAWHMFVRYMIDTSDRGEPFPHNTSWRGTYARFSNDSGRPEPGPGSGALGTNPGEGG